MKRRMLFGYVRTIRQYLASPKGGRDVRDWARAAFFAALTATAAIWILHEMGV